MRYRDVRSALAASVAICAVAVASPALAQTRTFDVPAQAAATGIPEFARQADIQILVSESATQGRTTRPVRGRMPVDRALRRLIEGTGLRLASGDGRTYTLSAGPGSGEGAAAGAPAGNEGVANEQIVVTGTNIRGSGPVGSPLIVHDREEILASGAATADQFLRTLPENFSSVDSIVTGGAFTAPIARGPSQTGTNSFGGAAANVHGAGPQATLTLLNGRRLAPAGGLGQFADVSSIPLAAIERIDVLTDGASAIYGSDAIGGVINFITRNDFEGAETLGSVNLYTRGGGRLIRLSQMAGAAWNGGNVLAAIDFTDQSPLDSRERSFLQADPFGLIVPDERRINAFATVAQQLTGNLRLSGDALFSERDTYLEFTSVDLGFSTSGDSSVRSAGGNLALDWRISPTWSTALQVGHYRTEQQIFTTFSGGFGTFESEVNTDFRVSSANIITSGSLLELPGGPARIAVGGAFRREQAISPTIIFPDGSDRSRRDVRSVFAETVVPLISSLNAARLAQELTVSLALRLDDYSDFGATTNPKIGLSWSPADSVRLRGSYGTSFRAPELIYLAPQPAYFAQLFPDPTAPTGERSVLIDGSSGNPDLEGEEAETWSLGFDLDPAPGLRFSATYYDISYTDRIGFPPYPNGNYLLALQLPELSAPFIQFSPLLGFVQTIFADSNFLGDFTGQGPAGVEAFLDNRPRNLAATRISGIDFSGAYSWSRGGNRYVATIAANYTRNYTFRAASTAPVLDVVNTVGQVPRLRINAGFSWSNDRASLGGVLRYVNAYENNVVLPAVTNVASWLTADANASYAFGRARELILSLNVSNLTDERPPRLRVTSDPADDTYDGANASPVGRAISIQVTKRW